MNSSATSRLEVHDTTRFELHHGDWGLHVLLAGLFVVLLVISNTILRFPFLIFLNRGSAQTLLIPWIQRSEIQGLTASSIGLFFRSLRDRKSVV